MFPFADHDRGVAVICMNLFVFIFLCWFIFLITVFCKIRKPWKIIDLYISYFQFSTLRISGNKSKRSFVLSSLEKLKFFRNNYYITLVIFCGLSMITIFIFIVLQSSQLASWIRSIFTIQRKYLPVHYMDQFHKRIFSLFSIYNRNRKHLLEIQFQITANNQKLLLKRFNHNQVGFCDKCDPKMIPQYVWLLGKCL